jgi:metal-responsive CopG/Arc/MetJ family transcriptional regulator
MNQENMSTHKRINITIHPIELEKLDKIAKEKQETRSGMIARLIQDYKE